MFSMWPMISPFPTPQYEIGRVRPVWRNKMLRFNKFRYKMVHVQKSRSGFFKISRGIPTWNLPKALPVKMWSTRPLFALSLLRCAAVRSDQPLGFQTSVVDHCSNFPDACNLYVSGYMSHKFENEKNRGSLNLVNHSLETWITNKS